MKDARPFWEACYQTGDELTTFGAPAEEVAALADKLPRGARILDLGCGDGRHALFLARRGCEVTAIDNSESAIKKLNRLAHDTGCNLRVLQADMREWQFEDLFDVIIAHGSLHLIARAAWIEVIKEMKTHTRRGGHNIVAVFTDRLPSPADLKVFHIGLFREGEVLEHYREWRVVEKQSYVFEDEHPGGTRHRHPINKLVARRPETKDDEGH